jgi:predicted O-methyltransferase YrrM
MIITDSKFQNIEGWFDFPEAYDFFIDNIPDGGVFVELGSFHGKSIIYFALRSKDKNKNVYINTVDFYYRKELVENLNNFGITNVNVIVGDSRNIKMSPVDCVFIDASHEYDNVCRDINNWLHQIKPGGILAGHDFLMKDVRKAVEEIIPSYQLIDTHFPHPSGPSWWYKLPD